MSIHTNFLELPESDLKFINALNDQMEDIYDILFIILVIAMVVLLILLVAFTYVVIKRDKETDEKTDNLLDYDHLKNNTDII